MKTFNVRCSFTDRRQGPGIGRSFTKTATSLSIAVSRAVKEFWKGLDRKQRFDVLTSGLEVRVTQPRIVNDPETT